MAGVVCIRPSEFSTADGDRCIEHTPLAWLPLVPYVTTLQMDYVGLALCRPEPEKW